MSNDLQAKVERMAVESEILQIDKTHGDACCFTCGGEYSGPSDAALLRFAQLVAEEAAKVCEEQWTVLGTASAGFHAWAIRERFGIKP